MKSLLLAVLLTGAAFHGQSQQLPATPAGAARTEEYCQLNAAWLKFNGKVAIFIDYGQPQNTLTTNALRDEKGRAVEFNSVIDALNWLNTQGWELVSAHSDDANSYYVMRRRITS